MTNIMNTAGEWVFALQRKSEERQDPYDEIYFRDNQDEMEYNGTSFLVREAIQNSLDARLSEEKPVRVVFRLCQMKPNNDNCDYLTSLFDRLDVPLKEHFKFSLKDTLKEPMRFLVYEDYNTRGLEGDVERYNAPKTKEGSEPEDFFWFWRNSGISGKQGGVGRWGLGKTVFNAASNVRTRFGYTVRKSDGQRFLMGKAILKTHEYCDQEFRPYGFWCDKQSAAKDLSNQDTLPIYQKEVLEDFCQRWQIRRQDEPGLSLVVPFVKNLTMKRIIQSVIGNFFMCILEGKLEVEFEENRAPLLTLDKGNLFEKMQKEFDPNSEKNSDVFKRFSVLPNNIQLLRETQKENKETSQHSIILTGKNIPTEENLKKTLDDQLDALRQRYDAGDILSFKVKFQLKHKILQAPWGWFYVYIQKDPQAKKQDGFFVRNGMTIPKVYAQDGFRTLVLIDELEKENKLSMLLGDTEGPAHENWETKMLDNKPWEQCVGRVNFVSNTPKYLHRILLTESSKPNYAVFSEFFPSGQSEGSSPKSGGIQTNTTKEDILISPPSNTTWHQIQTQSTGFRIVSSDIMAPKDARLEIIAAYCVAKGNPFRHWSPLDFCFYKQKNDHDSGFVFNKDQFRLKMENLEMVIPDTVEGCGNIIQIRPIDVNSPFRFDITGFDRKRDVQVEITDITEQSEEAVEESE